MYLHAMNSCVFIIKYVTHIETFRPFWCFKVKIWNLLIENLTWNIKWHLWGQHQEMCSQCCVDQKRRLLGKGTHQILRGIRSLHWKGSNLRHGRVFNDFLLIQAINNMNPRRYIAKGDLLTEKTGRSRSGLGLIFQGHGRRRRDWSQGVSWGSCKGLKRKTRELNSCEKKKALNSKNSMWTCFPWSFTGFHGFECFDLDSLLVGEAFQERAAKEKIMLEESFHVKS